MQVKTLVLAAVAGMIGWVVRGAASGAPAPAPTAAPVQIAAAPQIVYVAAPMRDAEPAGAPDDEDEGEDVGELLAKAQALAPVQEPKTVTRAHNGIHGIVTDAQSGEPLAGVTAIATSP